MKRHRDSYRLRVYAAEQVAAARDYRGIQFKTQGEHQEYLDRLTEKIQVAPVQVVWSPRMKGTRAYAAPQSRRIMVPANGAGSWVRCELFTLHEAAHIFQPPLTAYHGPEFLKVYLDLVHLQMGATMRDRLAGKMRQARVPLPPPYCN